MTIEQFNQTGFHKGMKVIFKGITYDIVSLDFEEKLIGIYENIEGADKQEVSWKRCENCELL